MAFGLDIEISSLSLKLSRDIQTGVSRRLSVVIEELSTAQFQSVFVLKYGTFHHTSPRRCLDGVVLLAIWVSASSSKSRELDCLIEEILPA